MHSRKYLNTTSSPKSNETSDTFKTDSHITELFIGCLPADSEAGELVALFIPLCTKVVSISLKYRKENICAGFGFLKC